MAHLDRVDRGISLDLLNHPAGTDRFGGDPDLKIGAVGAAVAHRWEPLSRALFSFRC